MTVFVYEGFATKPVERSRIENILKQLERSEIGRRFLGSMPPRVTFRYVEGDAYSRASADIRTYTIFVPRNTFDSPFATAQTIIHELTHQIQRVPQIDEGMKAILEGASRILIRHRHDKRFAWVAEPLRRIKNEETLAQDMVGAIFKLGYGRSYDSHYYIPENRMAPAKGKLISNLTADGRRVFETLKRTLRATTLPARDRQANIRAYEDFYRRAESAGWVGRDAKFQAMLNKERGARGLQPSNR